MIRASLEHVAQINRWLERDSGEPVDFAEILSNGMNICLLEGEGGAVFVWRGPGIYEAHVFFEHRGKAVLDLSHQMLDYMREHGAKLFWAAVPVKSRNVIMFTRLMGWKSHGTETFPHGCCEIFSSET